MPVATWMGSDGQREGLGHTTPRSNVIRWNEVRSCFCLSFLQVGEYPTLPSFRLFAQPIFNDNS